MADSAPRLKVAYRAVGDLKPYGRNARTHTEQQIAQVADSITQFGWTNPILLRDDDSIIAGHARLQAAISLNIDKVPTIKLSSMSDEQARAYVLADNKLAENAGWDEDILAGELRALKDEGFEIGVIGFSDDEIAALLVPVGEEGYTDPDEAPELSQTAVSRPGDVWLCGPHRIVCGDSTVPESVDRCLGNVRPPLMVTDPPYGVDYDPEHRVRTGLSRDSNVATGRVLNDDRADWGDAWALFPGSVAYVWHAGTRAHVVAQSLERCGFHIRAQIIWVKNRFAISRGHYHHQHEPVFDASREEEVSHETGNYAVREKAKAGWHGDRKQSTVWFISHRANDTGHGTQKPVECMERPIRNNSAPGQPVYDPFLGSGTTLIACQRTGRVCHAIELDPRYVDMAVRRWEAYTRQHAVLEQGGPEGFDHVAADRAKESDKGES